MTPVVPPPGPASFSQTTLSQAAAALSWIGGALLAMWGFLRVVFRPFIDDSRLASWKRRATEAEAFMREHMFKEDLGQMARLEQLVTQNALAVAGLTADAARHAAAVQHATSILNSLPHLAGSMEQMSTSLERMAAQLDETNRIARQNGETIAAHSAILQERRSAEPRRAEDRERRMQPTPPAPAPVVTRRALPPATDGGDTTEP